MVKQNHLTNGIVIELFQYSKTLCYTLHQFIEDTQENYITTSMLTFNNFNKGIH